MNKLLIIVLPVIFLSGCIQNKVVEFQLSSSNHGITIIDKRPDEEKNVRTPTFGDPSTNSKFWLGDKNFKPDRLVILASKLKEAFPDKVSPTLTINKFEVISYLPRESSGASAAGMAATSYVAALMIENSNDIAESDWIYGDIEGVFDGVSFKSRAVHSFIYGSSEKEFSKAIHDGTIKLIKSAIADIQSHNKQLKNDAE